MNYSSQIFVSWSHNMYSVTPRPCLLRHISSFNHVFLSSLGLSVAFPQHFSPPWKVLETSLSLRRQALPPKCTLRLGYPWTPVRTSCRCPSPGMTAATGPFTASSTRPCLRPSSASWRSSVFKTPSCGRSTKGMVGESHTVFYAVQSCLDYVSRCKSNV